MRYDDALKAREILDKIEHLRVIVLKILIDCVRSTTQSYALSEKDRDGNSHTIVIKHDQIKTLLKEIEKELDMLKATINNLYKLGEDVSNDTI